MMLACRDMARDKHKGYFGSIVELYSCRGSDFKSQNIPRDVMILHQCTKIYNICLVAKLCLGQTVLSLKKYLPALLSRTQINKISDKSMNLVSCTKIWLSHPRISEWLSFWVYPHFSPLKSLVRVPLVSVRYR